MTLSLGRLHGAGVAALLVGFAASAEPADAPNEVGVGVTSITYSSFLRDSRTVTGPELSYSRRLGQHGLSRAVRVGGGLRIASSPDVSVPVEGFGQAQLTARFGNWEAAVGLELGVTGFARLIPPVRSRSYEMLAFEEQRLTPLYLLVGAAPLRWHFGRFSVSALEVHLGSSLPSLGAALRMQVRFVGVGVTL
ncbi:MAG TPA: hypothetical protein VK447_08300 [Myxococcaceae bacterium]|nr:hypothetical protein [Myxococcaceae bacterium]